MPTLHLTRSPQATRTHKTKLLYWGRRRFTKTDLDHWACIGQWAIHRASSAVDLRLSQSTMRPLSSRIDFRFSFQSDCIGRINQALLQAGLAIHCELPSSYSANRHGLLHERHS